MADVPVQAGVVAAEVEALAGPEVAAAAAAGLRLGRLLGIHEMETSLAVSSAVDVALGARRPWSVDQTIRFGTTFPPALRHFLAHARREVRAKGSLAPAIVCDGAVAPPPVNEAVGAFGVAGRLAAKVLSDRPAVVDLVVAVCRCLSLTPPEGGAAPPVDRESVDLCLLRAGLRWRRDGAPPPLPATPAPLWPPGAEGVAFAWACARRVAGRPQVELLPAVLAAAVDELVAGGAPQDDVERRAGVLAAQLP